VESTNKRALKNNRNMTPSAETKDQNSKGLRCQEGPFLLGMRVFFLVIVMLAKTLDTKQFNSRNNYMRNIIDYGYPKDNHVNSISGNSHGFFNKKCNPFDLLMN
jgi:hypothetical protein